MQKSVELGSTTLCIDDDHATEGIYGELAGCVDGFFGGSVDSFEMFWF